MKRVSKLTKNERAILEACIARGDHSRRFVHVDDIISDLGGDGDANDRIARLVEKGLAEWMVEPTPAMMKNRVGPVLSHKLQRSAS